MATLEKAPTSNFWSTSLNGAINDSVTTITLNSTTGLQAPGRLVINRQDSTGQNTPSAREVISFTGISGSDLTGVTRGADNSTARSHADGSLVESAMVVGNWDALYKVVNQEHSTSGVHSVADMVTGGSVIDDDTFATASATKLATSESIKNFVGAGWTPANETWTYASATTITVPSGATNKYQKGDKIKLTQTTVKYFYIIGVADTLLTITGGSDYTLTNATISDNYYSKVENPQGFPYWFSYSPTYSAKASMTFTNVTTYISTFRIIGSEVLLYLSCSGALGGTASDTFYATTPVSNSTNWWTSVVLRNGDSSVIPGYAITYDSSIDRIAFVKFGGNFTLGSAGGARAILTYEY